MLEKQKIVERFFLENNLSSDAEVRILDLLSELGEVSKEILKGTDYGNKPLTQTENLTLEMGDLIFSTLALANSLGINLDDALEEALKIYKKRLAKGSPGSEND